MEENNTTKIQEKSVMIDSFPGVKLIQILSGDDEKELLNANEALENFVKKNVRYIKYAQIRTLHKAIKDAKSNSDLIKTMPLLAYIQGRQEKKEAKEFVRIIRESINNAIKQNISKDAIDNFIDAVVAYHKLYGN